LFNEFGHLPLQIGVGPNEVLHGSYSRQVFLVHAQLFVASKDDRGARSRLCRENLPAY
jgi:hypothetical protein